MLEAFRTWSASFHRLEIVTEPEGQVLRRPQFHSPRNNKAFMSAVQDQLDNVKGWDYNWTVQRTQMGKE